MGIKTVARRDTVTEVQTRELRNRPKSIRVRGGHFWSEEKGHTGWEMRLG